MHAFRPDETMTNQEASEVVRRHQEAAHADADRPRVGDLAEALGTTPEEVARILGEVRGSASVATETRRASLRGSRVAVAAGVAVLLFGASLVGIAQLTQGQPGGSAGRATWSPVRGKRRGGPPDVAPMGATVDVSPTAAAPSATVAGTTGSIP